MNTRTLTLALASMVIVVLIAGCSTGGGSNSAGGGTTSTPTAPATNTGAALRVYVVQQPAMNGNASILQFAATAAGSVSPASTITPGTIAAQVNTDQYGNIYYFSDHVVEVASGASGSPVAMREIQKGTTSRICCTDGMAVSPAGAVVLGQDNGEIDEWSSTASGTVAPTRYILGSSQTGGGASSVVVANQVAVDASDTLYVAALGAPGTSRVEVFSSAATGNAAPTRTVGPNSPAIGVAIDASSNVYTTASSCTNQVCSGTISVYAPSTTDNATPIRVITGSLTTLREVWGIKVDAVGNIYVVTTDALYTAPSVLKFAAGANGNVAPVSSFTSSAWTTPDFNASIALY